MADVRTIITEEDPQLHQPSVEVLRFGGALHRLLDDMKETLYHANGVGLAAPQVGINKRIIVVDDRESGFFEMVNPRIVESRGRMEGVEYCLSVPGRGGMVPRFTWVKIYAQDRHGHEICVIAEHYLARIFQHEIDHLNGTLFTDIMSEEVREEDEPKKRRVQAHRKRNQPAKE